MRCKFGIIAVIILIIAMSLVFMNSVNAATKSVTLRWTQNLRDPNNPNVDYFKIYGQPPGRILFSLFDYSTFATVPFTGVQAEYTYTFDESFPDGEITTINYYQTMVNTDGVETDPSNVKSVTQDMTPDDPPVQLDPIVN